MLKLVEFYRIIIKGHTIFKLFKKLSFFATGTGVATTLAATRLSSSIATTGNLIAVAGGSLYSIFKNLETASNIDKQGQYCSKLLADLRRLADTENAPELLRQLELSKTETENLLFRINTANENMRQSYNYATINAAVQIILSAISIGINAAASRSANLIVVIR